jgi:acetyltransferase-like isoleucine patch superfamily enzyme
MVLGNLESVQRFQRVLVHFWTVWRSDGVRGVLSRTRNVFLDSWSRVWMRFAGLSRLGRIATRLAAWSTPPYKGRCYLSALNRRGYVSPSATIHHSALQLGPNVFIGDRVVIFESDGGGSVDIGERARLWGDSLLETGEGGSITVGPQARIHRGVHLIAYKAPILIGRDSSVSVGSIFHSYDHGMAPDIPYITQPLQTKGPIIVGDHAWVGAGVIVSSGVRIGHHAVVAAGSVVTHDIPDGAIAAGVPARVIKKRSELVPTETNSSLKKARTDGLQPVGDR